MPEFKQYSSIRFEIQIRTILQHAWAEIEHDRNYKYSGTLPTEIQRNLNLLSGTLELVDNEFERISQSIERYSDDVSAQTKKGNLDIEINTTSLKRYLFDKFENIPFIMATFGVGEDNVDGVDEVKSMGINTLQEFENIMPKDFVKTISSLKPIDRISFNTIIRMILVIHDFDGYFQKAWKQHFGVTTSTFRTVIEKYGMDLSKLRRIVPDQTILL